MSEQVQPIIIIKRKGGHGGHHGGAWKVAYADFVTAMMAFFLLMWLLGSTTKGDLQGIAEYFSTPLKVSLSGGDGSGDSSSVIKGGGTDLTRAAGQVKRGTVVEEKKTINLQAAKAEIEKQEAERLLKLKADRNLTARVAVLAAKCEQGRLTPEERSEYENYVHFGSFVALLKSKARQILSESSSA